MKGNFTWWLFVVVNVCIMFFCFVNSFFSFNVFFYFFAFIHWFHTENASRFCHTNGTWDKSNYDQCDQIDLTHGIDTLPHLEYITHIWTAGYTLSLVSLILGIAIFIHFKWVFGFSLFLSLQLIPFNSISINKNFIRRQCWNGITNWLASNFISIIRHLQLNCVRECACACILSLQRSSLFAQHDTCKSIFDIHFNIATVAGAIGVGGKWCNLVCEPFISVCVCLFMCSVF